MPFPDQEEKNLIADKELVADEDEPDVEGHMLEEQSMNADQEERSILADED